MCFDIIRNNNEKNRYQKIAGSNNITLKERRDMEDQSNVYFKKLLQSYLFTEKYGDFFISTVHRSSSVMDEPCGKYYETYAWRLDKDKHRTDWVADNSGAISQSGAFDQHIEVCRQLETKGEFKEKE